MITNSFTHARRFVNRIIQEKSVLPAKVEGTEFSSFSTVLFDKYLINLIHCPITASGSYVVPDSVESIGIEAFAQCKGLTSIAFPLSLKTIGCLAFENCISLTTVTIPESIEEIGYRVFSRCTGLKSIYIQVMDPHKMKMNAEVFYGVDMASCILYVPVGAKKEYRRAEQWKEFDNILETEIVSAFTYAS
jgi:hypothetical protein